MDKCLDVISKIRFYSGNLLDIFTGAVGGDIANAVEYLSGRDINQVRRSFNRGTELASYISPIPRAITAPVKRVLTFASKGKKIGMAGRKSRYRKSRKPTKKRNRSKSYGSIKTKGNSYNNKSLKSSSKRKRTVSKSMSQKVALLESQFKKMVPSLSKHCQIFTEPWRYRTSAYCTKVVMEFPVHTKAKFDAAINSLRGFAVAVDQKTQMYGLRCNMRIKNHDISPMNISVKLFKCVDSTDDSPLELIRERILDRRLSGTGVGIVNAATPFNSGVDSFSPKNMVLSGAATLQDAIDVGGLSNYYIGVGKQYNVSLSAGDEAVFSWKIPDFVYNLEDYVESTETYLKKLNTFIIVESLGSLGQTNNLVGLSSQQLIGTYSDTIKCAFNDGEGSNTISNTGNFDNNGILGLNCGYQPQPVTVTF